MTEQLAEWFYNVSGEPLTVWWMVLLSANFGLALYVFMRTATRLLIDAFEQMYFYKKAEEANPEPEDLLQRLPDYRRSRRLGARWLSTVRSRNIADSDGVDPHVVSDLRYGPVDHLLAVTRTTSTMVGLLFTFVGLALALWVLGGAIDHALGATSTVEQEVDLPGFLDEVGTMLPALSTAFSSSVSGIILSLVIGIFAVVLRAARTALVARYELFYIRYLEPSLRRAHPSPEYGQLQLLEGINAKLEGLGVLAGRGPDVAAALTSLTSIEAGTRKTSGSVAEIRDAVTGHVSSIKDGVARLVSDSERHNDIIAELDEATVKLNQTVSEVPERLLDVGNRFYESLEERDAKLSENLLLAARSIGDGGEKAGTAIEEGGRNAGQMLTRVGVATAQRLDTAGESFANKLSTTATTLSAGLTEAGEIAGARLAEGAGAGGEQLKASAGNAANRIAVAGQVTAEELTGAARVFESAAASGAKELSEAITDAAENLTAAGEAARTSMESGAHTGGRTLVASGVAAGEGIRTGGEFAGQELRDAAEAASNSMGERAAKERAVWESFFEAHGQLQNEWKLESESIVEGLRSGAELLRGLEHASRQLGTAVAATEAMIASTETRSRQFVNDVADLLSGVPDLVAVSAEATSHAAKVADDLVAELRSDGVRLLSSKASGLPELLEEERRNRQALSEVTRSILGIPTALAGMDKAAEQLGRTSIALIGALDRLAGAAATETEPALSGTGVDEDVVRDIFEAVMQRQEESWYARQRLQAEEQRRELERTLNEVRVAARSLSDMAEELQRPFWKRLR